MVNAAVTGTLSKVTGDAGVDNSIRGARFFFAWTDKGANIWNPTYLRQDEEVFGFNITQAEGEFAGMDLDILNPRVSFLGPTRKQWAWLSYRKRNGVVVPLFYGRLIGVPQGLQDNVVRCEFVSRPVDYDAAKVAVAEALKTAPYWDDIWFSEEERNDPDRVLEGRTALWHTGRFSSGVSATPIIATGGTAFGGGDVEYESVQITYTQSPARKAVVQAAVQWNQEGKGEVDLTRRIIKAFDNLTIGGVTAVDGGPRPHGNVINVIAGPDLIANWPKFGAAIGGGWVVGPSSAKVIGQAPLPPILVGNQQAMDAVAHWKDFPGSSLALQQLFDRAPGFVVQIEDTTRPWANAGWLAHGDVNIMWLPVWQIGAKLKVRWKTSRQRTEVVNFSVEANVQPLLTEPGDDEVIYLTFGPADVDDFMEDKRRATFFETDRGHAALQSLLTQVSAHLYARARAVDVAFTLIDFEAGLNLSTSGAASIADDRLPGGLAAGKIKSYSISVDGDSGSMTASLTIGCAVGRNGVIDSDAGTPSYVNDGYVEPGYQDAAGRVIAIANGSIGYTLDHYLFDDDGVDLHHVDQDYITSLHVSGGLDEQRAAATGGGGVASSTAGVVDRINGVKTKVSITFKPVDGGPFTTFITDEGTDPDIILTQLQIPRTIDLEDVT